MRECVNVRMSECAKARRREYGSYIIYLKYNKLDEPENRLNGIDFKIG
jgi:hypothetical protein